MEKQELLSQKLYYLTIDGQNPFMMNNEFILLYSDVAKADAAKTKFTERFARQIDKNEITDNVEFIKEMLSFGFEKFIFNGDSSVYKFFDFHDGTEIIRHIQNVSVPAKVNNIPIMPTTQHKPKDKNASNSLICGIIGCLCPIIVLPVLALVFGIMSINSSKREGRAKEWKAIAGVVLGGIYILNTVLGVIIFIVMAVNGEVQI